MSDERADKQDIAEVLVRYSTVMARVILTLGHD